MAFNTELVSNLAHDSRTRKALERCLITKDQKSGVRFEQVIEYLSVCTSGWAEVFDIFDGPAFPTDLHYWAAAAIAGGSAVFTTNFDSLIEAAFGTIDRLSDCRSVRSLRVIYEEGLTGSPESSFEESLKHPYSPSLYKLHGSIRRVITDQFGNLTFEATDRFSIRAVLARIGDRTARFGLPPASAAVLSNKLKNRVLLVLGYSGLDDFDVLPTLCAHVQELKAVVWIAHHNQSPARARSLVSIPRTLRLALERSSVPSIVIKGRTNEIAQIHQMSSLKGIRTSSKPLKQIFPWLSRVDAPERELLIGMIFAAANEHRRALTSFRAAADHALRGGSYGLLSIAKRKIANILTAQAQYREAVATIKTAIKFDRSRDSRALADDYSLASDIFWSQARYETARRFAIAAQRIHRQLHSIEGEANDLTKLANVHWMRGELNDAARLSREAIRLNRRLNRKLEVARGLINIGSILRSQAKYDEALAALHEAKDLHESLRDEIGLASVLNNLGSVCLDKGALTIARQYYVKARDLNKKLGTLDHMATNIGNIGIVHRKRGQYRRALTYYQSALKINTAIGKLDGQVRDIGNMGVAYIRLNNLHKAEECLKRALRLSRRIGKAENEAVQLQNLGIVARMRGNNRLAIALFNRALSINLSMKRPLGISDMMHELGQVYLDEKRYADARRVLLRAYRIAEGRGIREGMAVVAQDLSAVFAALGNKKQAGRVGRISLREFKRLRRGKEARQVSHFLKTLA